MPCVSPARCSFGARVLDPGAAQWEAQAHKAHPDLSVCEHWRDSSQASSRPGAIWPGKSDTVGFLDRLAAVDRRLGIDSESERRGSKRLAVVTVATLSLVFMVPLGAALWNGNHDREVAAKLRREGVVANGHVVDVRAKGPLGGAVAGEEAKAAFRTAIGDERQHLGDGRGRAP